MKRNLLLLIALLAVAVGRAEIAVGDNQMWWGYFDAADSASLSYGGGLGYGSGATIDAAIRIPASEQIVSGSTIKGVRLWFPTDISAFSGSLRVWISASLPATGTVRADFRQAVAKTKLVGGLNEVEFTTPYEVEGKDIYVGYTITTSKAAYPILTYKPDMEEGLYVRLNNGAWGNYYGYGYGHLALQVLVESDNFPENCVSVADFGQIILTSSTLTEVPIAITNRGINPVTRINYTFSSDEEDEIYDHEKYFTPIPSGKSDTFKIYISREQEAVRKVKTLTVTKVNGEPNTSLSATGEGATITLSGKKTVTPVIEEFTGTWCGWCPRGMVGMEKVHERYGDQVVQIAAHNGDVMAISAYQTTINTYTSSFPNSITDRQFSGDPNYSNLVNKLTSAFNRTAVADIQLSAEWEDAEQKSVTFNTTTNFAYSDVTDQYAIAYVLTEDGLTGTGSSWAQTNNYNGATPDGTMDWWCTAGSPVSGVSYNHVAVAGWEVQNGVDGSVFPYIENGVPQEYAFTGSIAGNNLVQDKTQLKAIALLLDRSTGTIVNAAQSVISEKGTAISSVSSDAAEQSAVYSVDGRKLSSSRSGINIVRSADGSVRKVLVR